MNTLSGRIARLQDVFNIMYNEMGEENGGAFGGVRSMVEGMADAWRTIAGVVKSVATAYLALKAAAGLTWAIEHAGALKAIQFRKLFQLQTYTNVIQERELQAELARTNMQAQGLNKTILMNPWGIAAAAITGGIVLLWQWIEASGRLESALNDLYNEGQTNANKMAGDYVKLANTVRDVTKTEQEHNKALAELQKKYGDILPQHYLQAEGIRAMSGEYKDATEAIRQYAMEQAKSKMYYEATIDSTKEMYEAHKDFAE